MKKRLKDPDVARLFENTFPNTLDTTVKYFSAEKNLAFIITGVSSPVCLHPSIHHSKLYPNTLGHKVGRAFGYHVKILMGFVAHNG
jgi:meiotically up-regulated gene 157 (Mug157) protein